jgi:hypothetical protein
MKWVLALLSLVGSLLWVSLCLCGSSGAGEPFADGEGIELDRAIPANERGILCLTLGDKGRIYGGTTGRAAHLFVYDPAKEHVRSLARLEGGVGFAYALIRLPDGSLIGGTQADPTGTAVKTDPDAVGRLYRFTLKEDGSAQVEELGVPVKGQGIYTLAYLKETNQIAGNTWPDGHFFTYDLTTKKFKDHGAIAGYRTFETPQHAADLNRHTKAKISYPRQVSRAIAVDEKTGVYTGGAGGYLYRLDLKTQKLEKLKIRLPAVPGREAWASLEAAVFHPRMNREAGPYASLVGGTSDGYLFELRIFDKDKMVLRPRGRALGQGGIQGLVISKEPGGGKGGGGGEGGQGVTFRGLGGHRLGMPRWFVFRHGGGSSELSPGNIPRVDGQLSMVSFGALISDDKGNLYAGETDRIARLVRYSSKPRAKPKPTAKQPEKQTLGESPALEPPRKLACRIVFASAGTTTDGSGYTALRVGLDGKVYVGASRYGGYAWLLRFDPATKSLFMEKVVNVQQLTGEYLKGINTQGKIHAIILVGPDGRIWFATKQAHEIFDTRPEYGEDLEGYPGGHLCYYDPKTGFSRSVGILKRQEGLMGGAIDKARGKLYYRTEPKNLFLVYDIKSGQVQERGHVGAACRYMVSDKSGAVYSPGRGNYLTRYDPETGYLEDLAVKVQGKGGYTAPYVIALGPNGKLYGAGVSHPSIMEFDIDTYKKGPFPEVTMRNVAPAAPPGLPVNDIHAGVFGKDGRFYYPLLTNGPLVKGGKAEVHLRIMRFDPKTKKSETVGIPDTSSLDESKVKHAYVRDVKYKLDYIQGAVVGEDGTLYLMDIYPQLNVACFPKLTAP